MDGVTYEENEEPWLGGGGAGGGLPCIESKCGGGTEEGIPVQ